MRRTTNVTRGTGTTDVLNALTTATSVTSVKVGATTYPASPTNGYTLVNGSGSCSLTWAGTLKPAAGVVYTVVYVTPEASLQIRGSDYVKSAFVSALRAAYAAQTWFPLYRYNADDTQTGLGIHESFPKKPFKDPALVVSVGPMDVSRSTLPDTDFLCEETTGGVVTGFYSWGKMTPEVTISIVALTDSDRRKLTDITAIFVRHLFTRLFAKYGIGYQEVRVSGERDTAWQGQLLYMNEIRVPCYTEFQVRYPVDLMDVIDDIVISVDTEL